MKPWEDLAEALSTEIKREIAESYFQEKISLEQAWKDFEEKYKELNKREEELILNSCRIMLMLKEEELINEFQEITKFSLKNCYFPEIIESTNIRKRLFEKIKNLPFGFTSKTRFVKLFLQIYEDLCKAYNKYVKLFQNLEEEYRILLEKTQRFYKRYDLTSILSFFGKLEESTPSDVAITEEKGKVYEELQDKLKIPIPSSPSAIYEKYSEPVVLNKIKYSLIKLGKRAYQLHQEYSKELIKFVSKKD
ncbi:MAG: hypothetical protein ACK4FM_04130 [Caldimicrobium sp.]